MIKIDEAKCLGCGLCAAICEEVFEMNAENKASVKSHKSLPCVKEAIKECPVDSISE